MAFRYIFGDDDGTIYGVTTSGQLLWYRHVRRDGVTQWANGGTARQVGTGWAYFHHVFAGGDGEIYGVDPNGALLRYRHLSRDGDAAWGNAGTGEQIGSGWNQFLHVIPGGDGIVYGVRPTGEMLWYRHLRQAGVFHWAHGGTGQQIGEGWHQYARVFPGSDGTIYAMTAGGDLLWFRHMSREGRPEWRHGGAPQRIGSGWNGFTHVFSGRNGVVYGVRPDGALMWYRHLGRDGGAEWENGGTGVQIGSGWGDQTVAMEGYATPLSAAPGERIDFRTSTSASHYDVTYLHLKPGPSGSIGTAVMPPAAVPGRLQSVPADMWQHGGGWTPDFSLTIPDGWRSGLYAAQCVDSEGYTFHIVFVVKAPAGARSGLAVLANVNTWNAYNSYDGRSQYTTPNGTILSFERPDPSASPVGSGINHLARAETWVLGWMQDAGYAFDLYTDIDFHRGITDLNAYKALILHTHPEYWTTQMLDRLEAYIAGGGRVLYLGGNGIYERVAYLNGFRQIRLRDNPTGDRDLFRALTPPRPERAVLGVGYESDNWSGDTTLYRPYRVDDASHRFFAGTGLQNGDLIGHDGRNGAASGWEMDTSEELPGHAPGQAPANIQVLARGTNTGPDNTFSAHMTYYDTPAGGFVFAAGSLTFGGSLAEDPQLQAIVRNVLDECLAAP
jgi:N,N-dimethylformamidase